VSEALQNLGRVNRSSVHTLPQWLAAAAVALICCVSALATHGVLEFGQRSGVLQGDYDAHAHGMVLPVALLAVVAGMTALLLYVLHLLGAQPGALPSIARRSAAYFGWTSTSIAAGAAGLLLVGMETAEQLAAGRFDGIVSAFGSQPIFGLLLIVLFSFAANAALRACCHWIAAAHARIALAIAAPRAGNGGIIKASSSRRTRIAQGAYDCGASRVYGRRAPPVLG